MAKNKGPRRPSFGMPMSGPIAAEKIVTNAAIESMLARNRISYRFDPFVERRDSSELNTTKRAPDRSKNEYR